MPRFRFQKLVRDKIVEQQIANGAKPRHRTLDDEGHVRALLEKLGEEAAEALQASPDDLKEELADVQQVLNDLKLKIGVSNDELAEIQARKNAKNGAFLKGIFVEEVETAEDDPWTAYYRARPDQYPEIKGES